MPERKRATTSADKAATKTTTGNTKSTGFTAEERAAMRARAKELKAEARRADGEKILLEAVAKMPPADRTMAKKLHEVVTRAAPDLKPKTWYGMPAYANKNDKVICYFTPASKFKERYSTFGFNGQANLDDGEMWPTSFAVMKLTPAVEAKIAKLVKKAVG